MIVDKALSYARAFVYAVPVSGVAAAQQFPAFNASGNATAPIGGTYVAPAAGAPAYLQLSSSGATKGQAIAWNTPPITQQLMLSRLTCARFRVKAPSAAQVRLWMGLLNNDADIAADNWMGSTGGICFKYYTDSGHAVWQAAEGVSSGSQNTYPLTGFVPENVWHWFEIRNYADSSGNVSRIDWYIDGVRVARSSTPLATGASVNVNVGVAGNLGGGDKQIHIARIDAVGE